MLKNNILTSFRLMLENGMIIQLIKFMLGGRFGINNKYSTKNEVDNELKLNKDKTLIYLQKILNEDILNIINILSLASAQEIIDGLIDNKAISPKELLNKKANDINYGLSQYISPEELNNNKDLNIDKIISAQDIKKKLATNLILGMGKFCNDNDINTFEITNNSSLLTPYYLNKLINRYIGYINPEYKYNRMHYVFDKGLPKQTDIITPKYDMGYQYLEVYYDGLLCESEQYTEINSNVIQFLDDLPSGTTISLVVLPLSD